MAGIATISGVTVNEYLFSTANAAFGNGTIAASTITANAYGEKLLQKGTVLAKITSGTDSGKLGAYESGVSDGRQTAGNIVGISDTYINCTHDLDQEVGYLYAGIVDESKVYSDGTQGSLASAVKTALRSGDGTNILFK